MEKIHFQGPITALAELITDANNLVVFGSGGVLHCWETAVEIHRSLRIFDNHNIHGIKTLHHPHRQHDIIVFGDKAYALLRATSVVLDLTCVEMLDDLILDAAMCMSNGMAVLLIAYAHNMVDIKACSGESLALLGRVIFPDISVLFAASFRPSSSSSGSCCTIATGSVFGYVHVWNFSIANTQPALQESTNLIAKAKAHEGVIFRVTWNNAGDKFITVSDDRTVRLWQVLPDESQHLTLHQIFVGWGHICRIWDAVFVDSTECEVATSSEDGTLRLWDCSGNCSAILTGHSGSVWRLLSHQNGQYLMSGGNDNTIKCWELAHHRICSPANEISTAQQVSIPDWITDVANEVDGGEKVASNANRRRNGVNTIRIFEHIIVMVLIDGMVWVINTSNASKASDYHWHQLYHFQQAIVTASVSILEGQLHLAAAFMNGNCSYIRTQIAPSIEANRYITKFDWKPYPLKCVNIWILHSANETLICCATTKGMCSVWPTQTKSADQDHQQQDCTQSVLELTTERKEIASSILLHQLEDRIYLIIGDSRGGISVYQLRSVDDRFEVSNAQYFHRIHGTDPVSCLISHHLCGFISAGHDSSISFFEYCHSTTGGYWQHMNAMTTHPIHTPDQIFLPVCKERSHSSVPMKSLVIAGFHGSSFIVYDLLQGYQLMRIEGGGWKRPHHCSFTSEVSPRVLFACPLPVGKNETHLQVFGSIHVANSPALSADQGYQVQLGSSCFGRVVNCAITIVAPTGFDDLLVAGGEDCTAKVFSLPALQLLQETTLSKNSTLKSLSTASVSARLQQQAGCQGIVLGGGGKLLYYIWSYNFANTNAVLMPLRKLAVGTVWPQATQDHRILSTECLYQGQTTEQEHFVLFLSDSRGVLNILHLQVDFSSVEPKPYTIAALYEIEVSICPLLSSRVCILPCNEQKSRRDVVCCVGDTKGIVHAVLLPCCLQNSRLEVHSPCRLLSYEAHSMGTNALELCVLESKYDTTSMCISYVLLACSGGDDQALTCQRLFLQLQLQQGGDEWMARCCMLGQACTVTDAACAALKGMALLSSQHARLELATVAYDQRLSVWSIEAKSWIDNLTSASIDAVAVIDWKTVTASPHDIAACQKLSMVVADGHMMHLPCEQDLLIRWKEGVLTHVAEVSYLHAVRVDERVRMVVAGEGVQVFSTIVTL